MQKDRIITIVIAVIVAIIIAAIAGFIIYRFIVRRRKQTPTIDDTSPNEGGDETVTSGDDERNGDDAMGEHDADSSKLGNDDGQQSTNPFKGKVDVSDHDIRQFTTPQTTRHGSNESVKVITPTVRDLSMDDVIKDDMKERSERSTFGLSGGLFGNVGSFGTPFGVTIVTSKVGQWNRPEENAAPKVEEVSTAEGNDADGCTKVDAKIEVKDGHVRRRVRKHRKVNHDESNMKVNGEDARGDDAVKVNGEDARKEKVDVSYPGFREQIERSDGIGSDMLMSFGDSVYDQSYGYYGAGSGAFF